MTSSILVTKLFIPPPRPELVPRPRLIERLDQGLQRKLSLISAPAGFGKTTLVSEWLHTFGSSDPQDQQTKPKTAWLSLDADDNDPARFLAYVTAALLRIEALEESQGVGLLGMLQTSQPPPESILTALINQLAAAPDRVIFVLDDYHLVESPQVDQALAFLIEHLPPQMHLVIATREDPQLPLPRLRARGQLNELRAADLRFTSAEAAEFLNRSMGLSLSAQDINALETRTEGWIAGLQLAALSMQGGRQSEGFIENFTGSHQFVLDYLMEEVLQQQPENVQRFLLQTAVLDRLCGSLCNALTGREDGQGTLEYLAQANLFVVPLDNERRWYRYHHLFADLLCQRLGQSRDTSIRSAAELHIRASQWYEAQDLELEAFQHAAAAGDVERAARLLEGKGMPLHFRGRAAPVLKWLKSLPREEFEARPALWVTYAAVLVMTAQPAGIEEKLRAAEAALKDAEPDEETRNLIGHIASIRAAIAVPLQQVETILTQAKLALELVRPDNLPVLAGVYWSLGMAYTYQGDQGAAGQSFSEAISISRAARQVSLTIMVTIGLGNTQFAQNQLHLAAETYRSVLQLAGDPPRPISKEAYLQLARIHYEWDNLPAAEQNAQQSLELARQIDNMDSFAAAEIFLARLKLVQGDASGALALLTQADQMVRQRNFVYRMPELAAAQVQLLLNQGNLAEAAHLVKTHDLPLSQARVRLARGDSSAALAVLADLRRQLEDKGAQDERLKVLVFEALVLDANGDRETALERLGEALEMAEPGGFVRIFLDEGPPMAELLSAAAAQGILPDYTGKLLAAFEAQEQDKAGSAPISTPLVEPLSPRELEVLQLVAQGLSNREISERLYLALDTVKGHNRRIFGKLQVQRRTEAVARARQLGLI